MTNKIKPSKINRFKITTRYMSDRNKVMKIILKIDPCAKIKIKDDWSFKISTELSSTEICKIILNTSELESSFTFRKILFF